MKVTRKGFFETNSSSVHSITIGPDDVNDVLPVDATGRVQVKPGEFGWEVETYRDARTKASYCLTFAKRGTNGDLAILLHGVISAAMAGSARVVEFVPLPPNSWELTSRDGDDARENWGYIDHQSDDVAAEAFASPEALRAFIFNQKSVLHTDNDNREDYGR